jgi:hypothetical protein
MRGASCPSPRPSHRHGRVMFPAEHSNPHAAAAQMAAERLRKTVTLRRNF